MRTRYVVRVKQTANVKHYRGIRYVRRGNTIEVEPIYRSENDRR